VIGLEVEVNIVMDDIAGHDEPDLFKVQVASMWVWPTSTAVNRWPSSWRPHE
jgi:hypothetical protein